MSCPKIATFLFACCLTCLAQHQANESQRDSGSGSHAAPPSNSAGSSSPAAASSNSGSSSSHAASSNNSAGASSPAASSSNLSSRSSQESRNGQAQERSRDRNPETHGGVPHSKPEAPKPQATKPLPPVANPKAAATRRRSSNDNALIKAGEVCRRYGEILFNGVCVSSIPEAQGYGRHRNLQASQCNSAEERVRIANLRWQIARACGPQGDPAECAALKAKLGDVWLPDCQ